LIDTVLTWYSRLRGFQPLHLLFHNILLTTSTESQWMLLIHITSKFHTDWYSRLWARLKVITLTQTCVQQLPFWPKIEKDQRVPLLKRENNLILLKFIFRSFQRLAETFRQFHQHFTSSFRTNILSTKNFQAKQ